MLSSHNPANDTPDLPISAANSQSDQPHRSVLVRLHRPHRKIETFEVADDNARIRDIIAIGVDLVFIDDDEEPVDVELTLAQAITGRGRHHDHHDIHRHPCRWIDARISYGDTTQTLRAAPSSRIEIVRRRALDLFGLDADTAATLVLRRASTDTDLPDGDYLSDLAGREPCRLDLNLFRSAENGPHR